LPKAREEGHAPAVEQLGRHGEPDGTETHQPVTSRMTEPTAVHQKVADMFVSSGKYRL